VARSYVNWFVKAEVKNMPRKPIKTPVSKWPKRNEERRGGRKAGVLGLNRERREMADDALDGIKMGRVPEPVEARKTKGDITMRKHPFSKRRPRLN